MAKADFYDSYVGAVKALSAERVQVFLDTIKKGKVVLMKTDCYAIKSDTIIEIVGKNSPQNSSYFATLYKGWPLDSQANPLRVKALFKQIHGTNSTSGGAIVPCSVIDAHGLEAQVDRDTFERVDPPKKHGRQEELAEFPDTQKTGTRTPQVPSQKAEGSPGIKRRRSCASVAKPQESEKDVSMSVEGSDEDEEAEEDIEEESDEEDIPISLQEFDQFQHRIRTQLFGDDVRKINIEDHENLIEAYDKLKDKYAKLKKQADEYKASADILKAELEGWGRFQKAIHENMPTPKKE